jgi:ribonuclease P/MRP protein subunit POP1
LWLWIHPSAYHEALQFIQQSIREQQLTVEINDLRQEILRFELVGPRSTALLQTVLDPVSDEKHEGNKLWKDLKSLRSSCSLSPGSVIGLLVNDPRLK